ncbi:hypothetical protein C0995_006937 [Termitomyces sp. Mi166|nr:hypothetical protein C0995_006937 [Termitomyces sp. Mi166\
MSITPAMKAAARSAYRNLYRASSITFAGDEHVLKAFRMKMRNDAVAAQAIIDPETYEQQIQLGREVADVLRKNIVQGVRVPSAEGTPEVHETFRLRLTKHTELGSNETIKNPPPMELSDRSMRKQEKASQARHTSVTDVAPHNDSFAFFSPSHLSMNFSQLKKAHKERVLPELKEEDLEETFVRGTGPGGQSINKTENNVQLLHKPTGIRVSCQETRSLKLNRHIARKNLLEKVVVLPNRYIYTSLMGLSKEEFARAKQRERERRRRKKAKKKAAEKALAEADENFIIDLDEMESEEIEQQEREQSQQLSLEAATSRLEEIAELNSTIAPRLGSTDSSSGFPSVAPIASSPSPTVSAPPPPPPPPPPPAIPPLPPVVPGVPEVPKSVTAFDEIVIGPKVKPFVELTKSFATAPVIELADLIANQFQDVRSLILLSANCQQPDQKTREGLLMPLLAGIEEVTRAREKNRKERDWFGHITFLSEVGAHVGWVVNGITVEAYQSGAKGTSVAPPLPPPPPPPPPAAGPAAGAGGVAAVFAQLNRGEEVTKGLRKVDKSEMTHKNPALRASSVVHASSSAPKKPIKPIKPQALTGKKPPKFALEGNKWTIEYQENERSLIVEETSLNQSINIFGCKSSTIVVKGKVNAVTLVNCQGTSVLVESVVSSISVTRSPSFALQVMGTAPMIQLDSTDSGQIYLSKDSLGTEITTAKCSAINVSLPVEGEEEGVFEEQAVPEMLRTVVKSGKLVTSVVEHVG